MSDYRDNVVSDDHLIAAILADGNECAFRDLYRRHTPRLYLFVLRLLGGSETDAENVVQEAWLRAVEALGRFRAESSFSTWLLGIGLNLSRNHLRKTQRWAAEALPEPLTVQQPPIDHVQNIDLERAIASLPNDLRAVLVLHDVEGMVHRDIAQSLDIAVGTSKSRLSQARRILRSLLAPEGESTHGR